MSFKRAGNADRTLNCVSIIHKLLGIDKLEKVDDGNGYHTAIISKLKQKVLESKQSSPLAAVNSDVFCFLFRFAVCGSLQN